MKTVTLVKYDSKIYDYSFTDVIGVYSSRKKASMAIQKLMLYVEEDLDNEKISYTSTYESDKARGHIKAEKGTEYSYYCVEYPFDALETADRIEPI